MAAEGDTTADPVGPALVAETTIRPRSGWASLDLREIWRYRELLYFLVWRDIKVRYKQTALGISWAIIQPLFAMVIFSVIFGAFARIPSDGLPYPLFAYAGLLPWTFFSSSVDRSSASVVSNAGLISKVYFPRLIIPLAAVMAALVDLAFAAVVLFGLLVFFHVALTPALLWVLPLLALTALLALAVGLSLSTLNVYYRDVRHALPFLLQLWLYATPIVYPTSLIPEQWRALFSLNPMIGLIDGFRWALLGAGSPPGSAVLVAVGVIALLLVLGAQYFGRMERTFADAI